MGDGDWWNALEMHLNPLWIGGHLPGCGGGGGLGVRAVLSFGALRLGYLWLYENSPEWLRLL